MATKECIEGHYMAAIKCIGEARQRRSSSMSHGTNVRKGL